MLTWIRHVVTGWSIAPNDKTKEMMYEIRLQRLASEPSMDLVMRRPYSDEVEDYKEFKRLRQLARERQEEGTKAQKDAAAPKLAVFVDGTLDTMIGEAEDDDKTSVEKPDQGRLSQGHKDSVISM